MKKLLSIICVILMVVSLVGCSQQASSQKSQEELKAEIKAEMEAEAKQKAEMEAKKQAAQKPEEKKQPVQDANPPKTNTNSTTNNTTESGNSNVQQPVLLKSYEINKEYKYDLDGDKIIDTFSLETDSSDYINLFVNEWGYSVALEEIPPELLYGKYKLVNIDGNKQLLTFFVGDPGNNGYQVYFYEYAALGYGKNDSTKKESEELLKLGVLNVDVGADFTAFFDASIELYDDQVKIGDKTYTF